MIRLFLLLLCLALLAGCRHAPVHESASTAEGGATVVGPGANDLLAAQSAREAGLAEAGPWQMTGRLAVSAGRDGGSGRISWRQDGDDYQITLSAPVTRRSWVLSRHDGVVRLSGLEGGERQGDDAEALLAEATGWRLPVQALAAWARGARASGPAQIEFGSDGLPRSISQQGWQVEYKEWSAGEPARPRRVFARQGDASVRLVVESWEP